MATFSSKNTQLTVSGGAGYVNLATLISGEDQTNNVVVVEQGRFSAEVLAASAASDDLPVGGTGAAGDYLNHVVFPLATATGNCTISDGTTTLTFPATTPAGTYYLHWTGAAKFTVNNSANDGSAIWCFGRFTA